MELQEFIKETLVQITNGVIEAQKEIKETGGLINPKSWTKDLLSSSSSDNHLNTIQKVKMNVVVNGISYAVDLQEVK